ncbi:hypothetical protein [Echinimonas agarilytica]|uniref:Uncharacterized protein n=1 Tax=Echinimonas agarilytica TaxID=1215918 RepID=A0AA42B667_9GAMM|nr:hypothetical protein [Echinimonas agarilytica]MCM2678442.1 hypothetical protein [Echinimonas agarilytica]
MTRYYGLFIGFVLGALLALQIAASWHSAAHLSEADSATHHCTLCLVKSSVATPTSLLVILIPLLSLGFCTRTFVCLRFILSISEPGHCRGPPSIV